MSTIKQVANRARVSASTVSRVLSGKTYVDEEMRERVAMAIKELDYTPNVFARALKEKKSKIIGLIVPDIENQIVPTITAAVEETARKNGYTVILCNTDHNREIELEYIAKLKNRWADGLIMLSATNESRHLVELRKSGFPLVLISRAIKNEVDAVVVDNFQSTYNAVSYLIKTGHKHIAVATGNRSLDLYEQRYQGYRQALLDHGLEVKAEYEINAITGIYSLGRLTQGLMNQKPRPDAIFVTSDPAAIVVIRAIKDCGLRVPEDVSVVGMDNITMSQYVDPPLTTISQPLEDMGKIATQKLIRMMEINANEPPVIDVLPTEFLVRKSTR